MKKFFFPLETVLNYKEQVLDSLKGEHARALMKVRDCEQMIKELEESYRKCAEEFEAEKRKSISISRVHTYENYLELVSLKILRKREELVRLKEEEQRRREAVIEAKKESASIEKLKEKKLKEYEKEVQKSEEQFIEEFVSNQRAFSNG